MYEIKKMLAFLIILILLFSIASCSHQNEEAPSSMPSELPYEPEEVSDDLPVEKIVLTDNADITIPVFDLGKFTVSDEAEVIERERFIIYIEEDVVYLKELPDFIEMAMNLMEEETGLSFYTEGYAPEKLKINVVKNSNPFATKSEITVEQMDMHIYDRGYAFVFFHELSHVLQMRNGETDSMVFMEGYAKFNETKYTDMILKPNIVRSFRLHSYFNRDDSVFRDPEQCFRSFKGHEAYLYGVRIFTYIDEKYGYGKISEIIKIMGERYKEEGASTDQLVQIIKSVTSEEFFSEFRSWYRENKDIFDGSDVLDLTEYKTFNYIPLYDMSQKTYAPHVIEYSDYCILDFTDGFRYLQHFDYEIKGIYGIAESTGKHALEFYNYRDELIKIINLDNEMLDICTDGAVKIKITGDGSEIYIGPDR